MSEPATHLGHSDSLDAASKARLKRELAELRWMLKDNAACLRALVQHKTNAPFGADHKEPHHA